MANFNIAWTDTDGTPSDVDLHVPYNKAESGQLSFGVNNFSFRSGNYASYINGLDDEMLSLNGYEDVDAMTKFEALHYVMDSCLEVTISGLNSEDDGTYIIASLSYSPIGLDVFEYRIQLKYISNEVDLGFPETFDEWELD
ncbi:MAG: hypothetical protein EHM34_00125 [Nitrosopumilales archaeon]|nr:MAG: hypothetical protein EHM34_00125 [Nitrosopumilales archaeon]